MKTSISRWVKRIGWSVAAAVIGIVMLAAASAWAVGQNDIGAEGIARGAPDTNAPARFSRTGWNAKVRQRFMHPPVFTYAPMAGAVKYRCMVKWQDAKGEEQTAPMESATPEFDLANIWQALPVSGSFVVNAGAVDAQGKVFAAVDTACQRIAPFKGPYRTAKCEYGESGVKTVAWLLKTRPGTRGYPALFYSSYIPLLTTYVRLNPKGEMAEAALSKAKEYGQEMLKCSTPADWVYANLPLSHAGKGSTQVDRGGIAGRAYLDLYAVTRDKTWLDAAGRIADTLKKNQLPEGCWPFRVEPQTGKVLSKYTADQAESILMLDELIRNHGRKDLRETLDKAVAWMLENPCRTYRWAGGFEDCGGEENGSLTGVGAALFIEYLLRHAGPGNRYEQIAQDLLRYIDDQFVEWEPTGNQITPGVREQYACYVNEDAIVGLYIRVCMAFHTKTRDEVWMRKARAMADTLTAVQHADGFYPTFMTHKPSKASPTELKDINYTSIWPNCSAYAAWMLLRLGEYVKAANAE